jgi:hypothetical protein
MTLLFRFKSYSVNEIIAAGGVDAFVEKIGKSNSWATLMEALSKLPEDAFLTDEEAEAALKMLRENK